MLNPLMYILMVYLLTVLESVGEPCTGYLYAKAHWSRGGGYQEELATLLRDAQPVSNQRGNRAWCLRLAWNGVQVMINEDLNYHYSLNESCTNTVSSISR